MTIGRKIRKQLYQIKYSLHERVFREKLYNTTLLSLSLLTILVGLLHIVINSLYKLPTVKEISQNISLLKHQKIGSLLSKDSSFSVNTASRNSTEKFQEVVPIKDLGIAISHISLYFSIEQGTSQKVFTLTSLGAKQVVLEGYPTKYGKGINWSPNVLSFSSRLTQDVYIYVADFIPGGVYTGKITLSSSPSGIKRTIADITIQVLKKNVVTASERRTYSSESVPKSTPQRQSSPKPSAPSQGSSDTPSSPTIGTSPTTGDTRTQPVDTVQQVVKILDPTRTPLSGL